MAGNKAESPSGWLPRALPSPLQHGQEMEKVEERLQDFLPCRAVPPAVVPHRSPGKGLCCLPTSPTPSPPALLSHGQAAPLPRQTAGADSYTAL